MQVNDVVAQKGHQVYAVEIDWPVRKLAKLFSNKNIGAAPVLDSQGILLGIVSERDIIRFFNEFGASFSDLRVSDVMVRSVITCTPETTTDSALSLMTLHRIRHLPVVRNERISGIISIRDLLEFLMSAALSESMAAAEARRESEERYRLLADYTTDVIMLIGPGSERLYVSPACRDLFGYEPEELLNHPVGQLVHPDDRAAWVGTRAGSLHLPEDEVIQATYRIIRKDGSQVWVESSRRRLPGGGYVVSIRDVSERKEMQDQLAGANQLLKVLAATDGLTGLANRRHFDEMLGFEFRRAARNQTALSLVMIDIDHFKGFNDNYGHLAGDDCLKLVAQAVKDGVHRTGDVAARFGGEEFALILPNTPEVGAHSVAERIRRAVRALQIENVTSQRKLVTVSSGVASLVPDWKVHRAEEIVRAADRALYAAKAAGRDTVFPVSPV